MRGKMIAVVGVSIALMLLVAGCATVNRAGGGPAVTASSEELGRELNSGCPENANLIDPFDLVTGISKWVQAVEVEGERRNDGRVPVTIRDAEGRTSEARLIGSAWPGVDWGLANDSEVWIGMSTLTEGNVRMVMVVTPTQEVFFAGSCSDTYRTYFYSALGDRAGELLASLPDVDPANAYDHLGLPDPYASEEPNEPDVINLNDERVDPAVLDPLHGIELSVAISDVVGDGSLVVCTKIDAGSMAACRPTPTPWKASRSRCGPMTPGESSSGCSIVVRMPRSPWVSWEWRPLQARV